MFGDVASIPFSLFVVRTREWCSVRTVLKSLSIAGLEPECNARSALAFASTAAIGENGAKPARSSHNGISRDQDQYTHSGSTLASRTGRSYIA